MGTMSKYFALTEHLNALPKSLETVTLSFGQLKSILGFALPSSALNHRPWWANQQGNHPQSRAWMEAGFVVESINLGSQLVRFSRKRGLLSETVAKERSSETNPSGQAMHAPATQGRTLSPTAETNGSHLELAAIKANLIELGELAGCVFASDDVQIQWTAAPHKRPSSLPADTQAVYCFFLDQHCLKVGKAGPQSGPRFVSQHYFVNAPSTLAKSILAGKDRVTKLLKEELKAELQTMDDELIGRWIERHTARLNVLIPATAGPHALSLVEAFLQCRLQPVFEGHA